MKYGLKSRLLRAAALLLSLSIGCAPYRETVSLHLYAYLGRNIPSPIEHTGLSFSELEFSSTDPMLLADRIERLASRALDETADARELQAEWEKLYDAVETLESDASLAYVRHCLDMTDSAAASVSDRLNRSVDGLYAALYRAALQLSALPALRSAYSAETVAKIRQAVLLYDPAVQPLLDRELAIMDAYDTMTASFSIEQYGEVWDEQRLSADASLPFAQWYAIRKAFDEAFAAEAENLFWELIAVRKEIAATLGFANYPAYRYAIYARDYSPIDAARFSDRAKELLTPLFRDALQTTAADRQVLLLSGGSKTEAEWLGAVREVLELVDPNLCEPWDYMLSHGLYDCSPSNDKLTGSFTTYFAAYGAPFLYATWEDTYEMPSVLLHEFGHYAAYYVRGNAGCSLDLAEADSQGLELLSMRYYERLYGNRANEARAVKLCDMLYAILSGCMIDAFEQLVYGDLPDGASLSDLFGQLCVAYGLDDAGFTATTWVHIPHLFRAPSYYISYALGAATALELYDIQTANPVRARAVYRTLLRESAESRRAVLRDCGLTEPLSDGNMNTIEQVLRHSLQEGSHT